MLSQKVNVVSNTKMMMILISFNIFDVQHEINITPTKTTCICTPPPPLDGQLMMLNIRAGKNLRQTVSNTILLF